MQQLIVFTGLPGVGKSSIAEPVGQALEVPVFAKDWLEAALLRSGLGAGREGERTGYAAYELLITLAGRQLALGQSAILDSVASVENVRRQWRELAAEHGARWRVIECICSDPALHRARLAVRQRGIPGWHELDWTEVERVRGYYAPWEEERLVLDTVQPLQDTIRQALDFLKGV
jgi:predicted kinase